MMYNFSYLTKDDWISKKKSLIRKILRWSVTFAKALYIKDLDIYKGLENYTYRLFFRLIVQKPGIYIDIILLRI